MLYLWKCCQNRYFTCGELDRSVEYFEVLMLVWKVLLKDVDWCTNYIVLDCVLQSSNCDFFVVDLTCRSLCVYFSLYQYQTSLFNMLLYNKWKTKQPFHNVMFSLVVECDLWKCLSIFMVYVFEVFREKSLNKINKTYNC